MGKAINLGFMLAPIVPVAPIGHELFEIGTVGTAGSVFIREFGRITHPREALAQIAQHHIRYRYLESFLVHTLFLPMRRLTAETGHHTVPWTPAMSRSAEPPHREHRRGSGAAHFAQNFRPSRFSAAYFAHFISVAQLVEQRFRVLQVGGGEALGEPVVDVGQHRARLVAAISVAQQPRKTDSGAQLP